MLISIQYFLLVILLQSVVKPASQQADRIYRLFNFFNIAAVSMLSLVIFLVVFICIKFRQKKGDLKDPKPLPGNKKIEAVMIGIPALLLAWFSYQTITTMQAVAPSVENGRQPRLVGASVGK